MEQKPKKSFYHKERYERNKEEILKNRHEKYRTQQNKDLENIKVCKGTFTQIFFLYVLYIMYVLIGKEKCNHCNILKNLLDEKSIQYHYVDMKDMLHTTMNFLKCSVVVILWY